MPIITPPFRTSLLTQNGVPFGTGNGDIQTTRDWWLYWQQLTEQGNVNSKLASEGTHADRPDAGSMPDGALYYESDRGVLYANQGGIWRYVAGTMWGTAGSPDQRPTDLGADDVGFDFRTSVSPSREFMWSGGRWIEVTPMLYGTHAQRIAGTIADLWAGMAWMETDRGNVIYQNQSFLWIYVAGTMVAALASRPADLGTNDNGFRFESSDTRQSFRWSGSAWVETTGVGGAANLTHANVVTKVGSSGQIVEGGITDESAANSDKVHITAAGNLGVGTASASASLHAVRSDGSYQLKLEGLAPGLPHVYGIAVSGPGAFVIDDASAGANRLMLLPNGNIGIQASPSYLLHLGLDSAAKPATSTWTVFSDIKLKQNIEPMKDDSLAIVGKLNWVRYEYNGQAKTPGGLKGVGLLAQALQEQLPEAVRSSNTKLNESDSQESEILGIDYHHILVHSARAIQQLNAEVQSLKAMLAKP